MKFGKDAMFKRGLIATITDLAGENERLKDWCEANGCPYVTPRLEDETTARGNLIQAIVDSMPAKDHERDFEAAVKITEAVYSLIQTCLYPPVVEMPE